jgi:hypothetical protein
LIDFRYHLVSLVAVFLALAAGIVLGAGPLNDTLGHALEKQTQALSAQKRDLQGQVSSLQAQVNYGEDVAASLVAPTVFGRLTGQRVVLVTLPGADRKLAGSLTKTLIQSGAAVSGQVQINDAYVDPDKATVLADLTTHLAPPGVSLPITGPYDSSAFLLGDALVTRDPLLSGRPDEDSVALLSGYSEAGLITVTGDVDKRADLALVISALPPETVTDATDTAQQNLLPLASSLDDFGKGVVVVGPVGSAESGGYVHAIRTDHDSRRAISTDDAADLASGRIGTILALVEQFQGGVGHYGSGPGATDTLPRLTPDGVPSPTPTPSKSTSKPSHSASKPSHSSSASP